MSAGFLESLSQLGGTLVGTVGDVGSKWVDLELQKKAIKNTRRANETIQPTPANQTPANPTRGVNSNGETMVASNNNQPITQNKFIVYGGIGLASAIGLAFIYSLVKK